VCGDADLLTGGEAREAGSLGCGGFGELAGVQGQKSESGDDQQGKRVRDVLAAARQEEDGCQQASGDGGDDPRRGMPVVASEQNAGRKKESR
jgi:hypothetical protein